jgi:hypothetical protein
MYVDIARRQCSPIRRRSPSTDGNFTLISTKQKCNFSSVIEKRSSHKLLARDIKYQLFFILKSDLKYFGSTFIEIHCKQICVALCIVVSVIRLYFNRIVPPNAARDPAVSRTSMHPAYFVVGIEHQKRFISTAVSAVGNLCDLVHKIVCSVFKRLVNRQEYHGDN